MAIRLTISTSCSWYYPYWTSRLKIWGNGNICKWRKLQKPWKNCLKYFIENMKLNCHICAKYLPLLWLHTNACLSFHFMQLSKSRASSSVSRTIHSYQLAAKFEEVCSTIMALEMYLAEDKSSMPLSALPDLWALTSQPWLQPEAGRTQLMLLSEGWKTHLGVFPRLDLPSDTQPRFSACRAKHYQKSHLMEMKVTEKK